MVSQIQLTETWADHVIWTREYLVAAVAASHTSEKTFTDGIRLRNVIRCFENLDSTRHRNSLKAEPKLAFMITDEILRPLSIGGGLRSCCADPAIGRISYDAHSG